MKLFEIKDILLEGGAALQGTEAVTQSEAREVIHSLIQRIAHELNIPPTDIKQIGSAGKKERADSLSGDIDLAVKAPASEIQAAITNLSYDKKSHRAMPGLNVYAFAYKLNNKKVIQVDLMPCKNIEYAEWSLQAHEDDLKAGLKGAHRNELFFAIAKHADMIKKLNDEGTETIEMERYFYDLTRGLMRGTQSRKGAKKLSKGFKTVDKNLITDNPTEICEIMFGRGVNPKKVSTFDGALEAVLSPKFPYASARKEILAMTAEGLRKKGLKIPPSLEGRI